MLLTPLSWPWHWLPLAQPNTRTSFDHNYRISSLCALLLFYYFYYKIFPFSSSLWAPNCVWFASLPSHLHGHFCHVCFKCSLPGVEACHRLDKHFGFYAEAWVVAAISEHPSWQETVSISDPQSPKWFWSLALFSPQTWILAISLAESQDDLVKQNRSTQETDTHRSVPLHLHLLWWLRTLGPRLIITFSLQLAWLLSYPTTIKIASMPSGQYKEISADLWASGLVTNLYRLPTKSAS